MEQNNLFEAVKQMVLSLSDEQRKQVYEVIEKGERTK